MPSIQTSVLQADDHKLFQYVWGVIHSARVYQRNHAAGLCSLDVLRTHNAAALGRWQNVMGAFRDGSTAELDAPPPPLSTEAVLCFVLQLDGFVLYYSPQQELQTAGKVVISQGGSTTRAGRKSRAVGGVLRLQRLGGRPAAGVADASAAKREALPGKAPLGSPRKKSSFEGLSIHLSMSAQVAAAPKEPRAHADADAVEEVDGAGGLLGRRFPSPSLSPQRSRLADIITSASSPMPASEHKERPPEHEKSAAASAVAGAAEERAASPSLLTLELVDEEPGADLAAVAAAGLGSENSEERGGTTLASPIRMRSVSAKPPSPAAALASAAEALPLSIFRAGLPQLQEELSDYLRRLVINLRYA